MNIKIVSSTTLVLFYDEAKKPYSYEWGNRNSEFGTELKAPEGSYNLPVAIPFEQANIATLISFIKENGVFKARDQVVMG